MLAWEPDYTECTVSVTELQIREIGSHKHDAIASGNDSRHDELTCRLTTAAPGFKLTLTHHSTLEAEVSWRLGVDAGDHNGGHHDDPYGSL